MLDDDKLEMTIDLWIMVVIMAFVGSWAVITNTSCQPLACAAGAGLGLAASIGSVRIRALGDEASTEVARAKLRLTARRGCRS